MNDTEEAVDFAKVDSHLDSHPKIRKAGNIGRQVFEFVLRVNSRMRRDGSIPTRFIEPDYLAEQLMFEGEGKLELARNGLARAVAANLLLVDEEEELVYIVGWESAWGRRTVKSGRERTRDWRDRKRLEQIGNDGDARDAGDVIRGEESSLSPDLDPSHPELPDPDRAVAVAERVEPRSPPPGIPMPGLRDRRRKLNHDAWAYGALEHARLMGTIPGAGDAIPWPVMPAGEAMHELVKRTGELLEMHAEPNYDEAGKLFKRRIDVAVAESMREGHLRWFTPSQIFDAKKFWRAVEINPIDAAKPRASPRPPSTSPPEPTRRIQKLS